MAIIGTDIQKACELLNKNEVIGMPTETVYGLAGNALDSEAITKIFEVKQRPFFDPLIVHTFAIGQIERYVAYFPAKAKLLAEHFMPGPLTLLLPKKPNIPDLITSGLPNVAIRIPNHAITLNLLQNLAFPLAAPSANPFGYVSPTTAQHVDAQLGKRISYILDGGSCMVGIESTIIGFEGEVPIIYRKGGLAIEAIEELVGHVLINEHSESNPKAPGMLKSHYSPNIPIEITNRAIEITGEKVGALVFSNYWPDIPIKNQLILSESGNYHEAARNVFAFLRKAETLDIDKLYVELLPEIGLGRAINDRLRRAASKN
jgi:L-threonylcarbamoyladenylate synthase